MLDGRKTEIKNIVGTAVSQIAGLYKLAQSGAISEEEAKQRAAHLIHTVRFAGGNYLFIYHYDGTTLLHGTRADLEGKFRLHEKDADGKLFIEEQIANAKAGGGSRNTASRGPARIERLISKFLTMLLSNRGVGSFHPAFMPITSKLHSCRGFGGPSWCWPPSSVSLEWFLISCRARLPSP